jgi:hypothetical protein
MASGALGTSTGGNSWPWRAWDYDHGNLDWHLTSDRYDLARFNRQRHFNVADWALGGYYLKIGLNDGDSGELSDFQCAAALFYDRVLNDTEIMSVSVPPAANGLWQTLETQHAWLPAMLATPYTARPARLARHMRCQAAARTASATRHPGQPVLGSVHVATHMSCRPWSTRRWRSGWTTATASRPTPIATACSRSTSPLRRRRRRRRRLPSPAACPTPPTPPAGSARTRAAREQRGPAAAGFLLPAVRGRSCSSARYRTVWVEWRGHTHVVTFNICHPRLP